MHYVFGVTCPTLFVSKAKYEKGSSKRVKLLMH